MRVDRHDYDVLIKYVFKDNGKTITFIIDKADNSLYVSGDYGNYFGSWGREDICEALAKEEDLLSHISKRCAIDWDRTIELIAQRACGEDDEERLDTIRSELYDCVAENHNLYDFIPEAAFIAEIDSDDVQIAYDYPYDAIVVEDMFEENIKPLIKRYDV